MQAILTRFIPATNYRPSRIKAVCNAGSLPLAWGHGLNIDGNHAYAAGALLAKLGWDDTFTLASGSLPSGEQCHVLVPKKKKRGHK